MFTEDMCDGLEWRERFPRKETKREHYLRVQQERYESDEYMKHRCRTIKQVYSIPLQKIHYEHFIRRTIPEADALREETRRNYMHLNTNHCVRISDSGSIQANSKLLGDKMPGCFYRTTKLAAWKLYRSARLPPFATGDWNKIRKGEVGIYSFPGYKQLINQTIEDTKEMENDPLKVEADIDPREAGCFIVVKDYVPIMHAQMAELAKQARMAELAVLEDSSNPEDQTVFPEWDEYNSSTTEDTIPQSETAPSDAYSSSPAVTTESERRSPERTESTQ